MDQTDLFQEKLASLKDDLKSYGDEIVNHLASLYHFDPKQSSSSKSFDVDLKTDPNAMIKVLKQEVNEVLAESQLQKMYELKYQSEIKECAELTNILSDIALAADKIVECDQALNNVELIPACQLLEELLLVLTRLSGSNLDLNNSTICSTLKREANIIKSRLVSKLRRITKEIIQFDHGAIVVLKQHKGILRSEDRILEQPLDLSDVWTASISIQSTTTILTEIIEQLWLMILDPLWKIKKCQPPSINCTPNKSELTFESISRDVNTISSKSQTPKFVLGISKLALPNLIEYLGHVFSFLWSEVFCANTKVTEMVTAELIKPPYDLYNTLLNTISHSLPKVESDLSVFRKSLELPCKALEDKLALYSSNSNANSNPLTAYLQDLPTHFATQKRREILERAREIVLSDYHNTMMATGDALEDELSTAGDIGDPQAILDQSGSFAAQKLKFDSCQISLAVCRLLKLVHEVMKQCSTASPNLANILFHSARDCIEIFIAIVPIKFSDTIRTIPRMGAVFFNDCLYIIHNCTLITFKYKQELVKIDEVLHDVIGYADFIPRLRAIGDNCLLDHFEVQCRILSEFITQIHLNPDIDVSMKENESTVQTNNQTDVRPGLLFKSIGNKFGLVPPTESSSAPPMDGVEKSNSKVSASTVDNNEESALKLVKQLEKLRTEWFGVLQENVYCRIIGQLLEKVLLDLVTPILHAECITERAGHDIGRIFRTIQQTRAIFPTEFNTNEGIQSFAPSWNKYLALTDLLDYSLSEVAEWLPRKKFAAFTGLEMTSLIKALFDDSTRRQGILASILEMSS